MTQLALYVAVLICIYVTMVAPLNLMMGYGGLVSMTPAGFFGIGAYTVGILSTTYALGFLPSLAGALIAAAVVSAVICIPLLRLRGDYFVIGTLACQVVAQSVMLNWVEVTKGPIGLSGIPHPELAGVVVGDYSGFLLLSGSIAILTFLSAWMIARSPTAVLLRGIRDDETAVTSLGRNAYRLKVYITVYAAMALAAGGALFAYLLTALDPSPFSITTSIFLISLVIVGGSGNLYGPVIGCLLLVPLPEVLSFLNFPTTVAAEIRNILYGLLLILAMRFRPQGLIGERTMFSRRLQSGTAGAGSGGASDE